MISQKKYDTIIVGAGFTGLTAAYSLSKRGKQVRVIEASSRQGGLAETFEFDDGIRLEKFYHHWFNNDEYAPKLAKELGLENEITSLPTQTGMYFKKRIWKLSTPLDLLRFKPLSLIDRIRLGLLVIKVRRIKDWKTIEHMTIREWLEPLCGKKVYSVVWNPLVTSKFSIFSESINAVWMWKKLVLRGGTRNSSGGEELAYFKGGFGRLTDALVSAIEKAGGVVSFGEKATGLVTEGDKIHSIRTDKSEIRAKNYLFTPALPLIADIFKGEADLLWIDSLKKVRYLGNMCIVLRLSQKLSDIYWLNVNDSDFPFVGVIEHTNFDPPEHYGNSNIVFLSRYLSVEDTLWSNEDEQILEFALLHLQRMFPNLERSWIQEYRVWRAEYAQPVTERNYSDNIPGHETPFENAFISSMAQIYPEDRGTNYAIREGLAIAEKISNQFDIKRFS